MITMSVYKDIHLTSFLGEILCDEKQCRNLEGLFAICIVNNGDVSTQGNSNFPVLPDFLPMFSFVSYCN